jgi:hypothetical protein
MWNAHRTRQRESVIGKISFFPFLFFFAYRQSPPVEFVLIAQHTTTRRHAGRETQSFDISTSNRFARSITLAEKTKTTKIKYEEEMNH